MINKMLGLMTLVVVGASCHVKNKESPLAGYYIESGNGIIPTPSVWHDRSGTNWIGGRGAYPLTNWISVTSDSSPKIITSYLKSPRNSTAAPGQVWVSGVACYVNTPEVFVWPAETNVSKVGSNTWVSVSYEHRSTNDWPMLTHHSELIYVQWIEKAPGGRHKGLDSYAHCRVRQWVNSSLVESDAVLLLSEMTNTATLLQGTARKITN